jgi:coenzyme PQQ precursor peptide PqqA
MVALGNQRGDAIMTWEKPEFEIVETCCEINAYVYTE